MPGTNLIPCWRSWTVTGSTCFKWTLFNVKRLLLTESRCKPECNFDFELPSVADYAETLARPVAAIAMQQVNLPLDPTLSECDLTVWIFTIIWVFIKCNIYFRTSVSVVFLQRGTRFSDLALTLHLGKMFLCCIVKGDNKCSFFRWKSDQPLILLRFDYWQVNM